MADEDGFGDIQPQAVPRPVQEQNQHADEEHHADHSGHDSKVLDYYDIMIVGITGQGKSTTADKLLAASSPKPAEAAADVEGEHAEMEEEGEHEIKDRKLTVKDFTFWTVCDITKKKYIVQYLKTLELCQGLGEPHFEVNDARKHGDINPVTGSCQLVSNEATKMRVLDVPGFFSMRSPGSQEDRVQPSSLLETDIKRCTHKHLTVMRDILRIQSTMKVRLSRILYFLPVRGPLDRPSEVLMQELLLLARYFGKSIFQCMVLIATAQTRFSLMPEMQGQLFTEEESVTTREQFRRALTGVLPLHPQEELPNPPIVFISMRDDCNSIVAKVKKAEVAKDSLELTFDPGICIKCCSTVKWLEDEKVECIPVDAEDESSPIPYCDSLCHPIFMPKYGHLQEIEMEHDGAVSITIKQSVKEQRRADSSEEVCMKCGLAPGSPGCMKVGGTFPMTDQNRKTVMIKVDHTNQLEKHRVLRQSGEWQGVDSSSSSEEEREDSDDGSTHVHEATDTGGYASELVVPEESVVRSVRRKRDRDSRRPNVPGQSLLKEESGSGSGGDRKG